MGWRAARKLNWICLRFWTLAWSLNGGRDKKSAAWVLVPYYASEFKRCINERNPFSIKSNSKFENVCVCGKSETNALGLCAVQCHHVIHHKICKKLHLVWSAKGKKLFWWEAETLMRNASQSNLDSSKFTQRWDLNENWVTSPSSLQSCWRVMWIN